MAAALRMAVRVEGLRPTLAKVRKLPAEVKVKIRDVAGEVADAEAMRIKARAARTNRRAALAARSVRVRRGATPAIAVGGRGRLPNGSGTFGDLFFGAEFGGRGRKTTQQFLPHLGTEGYWFWPQLRDDESRVVEQFAGVVDDVAKDWGRP